MVKLSIGRGMKDRFIYGATKALRKPRHTMSPRGTEVRKLAPLYDVLIALIVYRPGEG
jgi:hypothetical protein